MTDYEVDNKDNAIVFGRIAPVPHCLKGIEVEGVECWHVFFYSSNPWPEGIAVFIDGRKCDHCLARLYLGYRHDAPLSLALRAMLWTNEAESEKHTVQMLKVCLRRWPDIDWHSLHHEDSQKPLIGKAILEHKAEKEAAAVVSDE